MPPMNLYLIWYEQEVEMLSGDFIVPIKLGQQVQKCTIFSFFSHLCPGKIYK